MYDVGQYESPADFLIASDIIVINYSHISIIPYHRDGRFSPLTDKDRTNIVIIKDNLALHYNNHKNSLIIVELNEF